MDPDSTDVFINGLPEKYSSRPNVLENMSFGDFAVKYDVLCKKTEIEDDVLPPEPSNEPSGRKITLKNKMGIMRKRARRAIIRYHKFSKDKEPEKYYHSLLMLFYPWRDEVKDLLAGFDTYFESFSMKKTVVEENKSKFEHFTDDIEKQVNEILEEGAFSESVWDHLASEVQHDQNLSMLEGSILDDNFNILCPPNIDSLIDASSKNTNSLPTTGSSVLATKLVDDTKFSEMVISLNVEQREVFQYILDWCCKSVTQKVTPFNLFVTGGAGCGKSHLIHTILQMSSRILRKPGDDPSNVYVHLTAPTGTAAYNIGGATLHSSFQLPLGQSNLHTNLSSEKIASLRNKFSHLKILVIDEISMVGATMLSIIHQRLQAIMSLPASVPFGGVSILAVGDLMQLSPVCDRNIYDHPKDPYYALADLWNSNFSVVELTEIMRQKGDQQFAEMLSRIRLGTMTQADIILLKSREITDCDDNDSIHLYATNRQVNSYNDKRLNSLPTPLRVFESKDKLPDNCTGFKIPTDDRHTGGLQSHLAIKIDCWVILIRNIDIEHGLVNGAQGVITGIIESSDLKTPKAILVLFDDARIQQWASHTYSHNKSVPVERFEARFPYLRRKVIN